MKKDDFDFYINKKGNVVICFDPSIGYGSSSFIFTLKGGSEKTDKTISDAVGSFDGLWESVSNGYEFYGTIQPMFYAKFSNGCIEYGHMNGEEFVLDHKDKIYKADKISAGYRIYAKTSDGSKYVYESAEGDTDALSYYGTWDKDQFMDKYTGTASLCRVGTH